MKFKKHLLKINIALMVLFILLAILVMPPIYKAVANAMTLGELQSLENQRKEYELLEMEKREQAQGLLNEAQELEKKKLETEPKIREIRAEILGKSQR